VIRKTLLALNIIALSLLVGCTAASTSGQEELDQEESTLLEIPPFPEAEIKEGDNLKVLATTSIIGDILSQVGSGRIDLTVLMAPGQDPHSFEPSAGDLAAASQAQVVFINGWELEKALVEDLANTVDNAPIVPLSAGITPLFSGDPRERNQNLSRQAVQFADPHIWLDPHLVKQWAINSSQVLSALDPANTLTYQANLEKYSQQLEDLITYFDEQVATIPSEQRQVVTNHDFLAYFASAYDFNIIGTVIPETSTLAEPSASEIVNLIREMEDNGVCAIFSESTVSDKLAQTAVNELDTCDEVRLIKLYTGALGPEGSGAENYLDMMRANITAIVKGVSRSKE
jgi:ABC-type Zn uptake system ZnuABC Zn-binding protein ZnuA